MQTCNHLPDLRKAVESLRARGDVALVPTMGALHEGHMALVRAAKAQAAAVVVSIFVNPRQFGPNEDLAAYPRRMEEDARLLAAEGVDLLWAPGVESMYPAGFATSVGVSGVSEGQCGAARPGHFDGVATVVLKLFNQVRPDLALFGEKDWQQLAVIRRMATDLDLVLPAAERILGIATVREADGLALSSRNAYLSPDERAKAAVLPAAMAHAVAELEQGARPAPVLEALVAALLGGGFAQVDYAELVDAATLAPVTAGFAAPARLMVAARIGRARLIDNLAVSLPSGPN